MKLKNMCVYFFIVYVAYGNDWNLVDKNNHITDIPTVNDFMPLNVTCTKSASHEISFPSNDPKFSFR